MYQRKTNLDYRNNTNKAIRQRQSGQKKNCKYFKRNFQKNMNGQYINEKLLY